MGGDANHVKYLAQELARRGHEVHVLYSLDAFKAKRGQNMVGVESDSVILHPIVTKLALTAYHAYVVGMSKAVTERFRSLIQTVKPDVVHHHNISLLGYSILPKHGNYLNLYTAHDYWLFCQQNNLLKFGKFHCTKKNCFSCSIVTHRPHQFWRDFPSFGEAIAEIDSVIAPSNFMRNTLLSELPNLNVHYVPNFAPRIGNMSRSDRTGPPYFVYLGVLENRKGVVQFLQYYAKSELRKAARVNVIGRGSIESSLLKFVRENRMEDSVSVLGHLPAHETRKELTNAVALVIPSIWPENAPLAALEALSVGLPVVGSDVGGIPEIVKHVDPKLVFSWNDSSSIGRSLQYSIEYHDALQASARNAYNNLFSPDKYVSSYLELISQQSS